MSKSMSKSRTSSVLGAVARAVIATGRAAKKVTSGERKCEMCRQRQAVTWGNRMHLCGSCGSGMRSAGGRRAHEPASHPRKGLIRGR